MCTCVWLSLTGLCLQPKREEPKKESSWSSQREQPKKESSWSSQRSNSFDRSPSRSESRGQSSSSSWNSQGSSSFSSRSRSSSPHEERLAQQKRILESRAAKPSGQSSQSSYYNQNKNSFGTPEVNISTVPDKFVHLAIVPVDLALWMQQTTPFYPLWCAVCTTEENYECGKATTVLVNFMSLVNGSCILYPLHMSCHCNICVRFVLWCTWKRSGSSHQ